MAGWWLFFLLLYISFFFSLSLSHTLIKKCHTFCIVYFYCGNWHSSYQPWSSLSLLVHCSRHFAYHACAVDRIPFATATESFSGFIPQGLGPFILIFIILCILYIYCYFSGSLCFRSIWPKRFRECVSFCFMLTMLFQWTDLFVACRLNISACGGANPNDHNNNKKASEGMRLGSKFMVARGSSFAAYLSFSP